MNNKRLFSIILVVFIDLLGFSLILPLLPYYAETFNANETITGILIASYAVMQLIGAPLLGRLSDRFGRRPVLLISVFGTFIGFLLLGFANALWMLFASRILDGLTGGNLSVAQAYISDVTDEKSRSKGLGMVGAAFGLGFIIGPVTGGLLSQWGYAVPAFVAAGISFLNLILIYAWLPESLTEEKRNQMTEKRPAVTLQALIVAFKRPFTGSLLITRFFYGLAFSIFQTIFSLYALAKFDLTARDTGFVLTYVGVLAVIVQGFLVGRLTTQFREDLLITVSVVLMGISLLGWALAPSVLWLYIIMTPTAISGGLLNTLLSSTLTKAVAPQEIGGILGLSAAVESATRIIAPLLGGVLLQQVGTWAPGAFGAVVMTGVSLYVFTTIYNHPIVATLKQGKTAPVPASD
ncbi:MAG TPA: MFS transporter [Anaerolineales bacterium]|nr:MFS transporter [Anaerolineales bacterium]HMX17652.1 MFS transporter [Anaerolineales bacterium]HMX73100.1 MFS transporter [Anaerolineales bacterium]HMZ42026.1 MFS transporter [Anaerolineales bacterium]HNA52886.1 MFS transporter [Anaerolineales bacterium]